MPFTFEHKTLCPVCPYGVCIEDRRVVRVRGRTTDFRFKQNTALACTFGDFVPGTDLDPQPGRTFDQYLSQFRQNALGAGAALFGETFGVVGNALAKVEGDVFELLEAAALWNAAAVWNQYMDTGKWVSKVFSLPADAVATPGRKVAIVKLPRGYDAMKLFKPDVRAAIQAHENALKRRGMELGLSSPDIVGIRCPEPMPGPYSAFLTPLDNLGEANRTLLESGHTRIEGTLDGRSFLLAIAVKRTTRSDRLYQPLFEANILKYLIIDVLRGAAFRFHVHLGSFEGSDVQGRYKAASLISLLRGGEPSLAIDSLLRAERPTEMAQSVLNDLPIFPL
jgi:hypothetical protein